MLITLQLTPQQAHMLHLALSYASQHIEVWREHCTEMAAQNIMPHAYRAFGRYAVQEAAQVMELQSVLEWAEMSS